MKWIRYRILQCIRGDSEVTIGKKVGYNDKNLAIARTEAHNFEYTIEEDDENVEIPAPLRKVLYDKPDNFDSTQNNTIIANAVDYSAFIIHVSVPVGDCAVICSKVKHYITNGYVVSGFNLISTSSGKKIFFRVQGSFSSDGSLSLNAYWAESPIFETEARATIDDVTGMI